MVRPPALPPEKKVRIVLSILAGEMTVAEAARRAKVSEQSIGSPAGPATGTSPAPAPGNSNSKPGSPT
jgi:hypothetical protein